MPPLGSVYMRLTYTPRGRLSVVTVSTGFPIFAVNVPVEERDDIIAGSRVPPVAVIPSHARVRVPHVHTGSVPSTTTR
jgi:hypothetical protein